ncbi:MAG TPA: hypothetical protein VGC99_16715 [Candidatus Tectomicrobia bacterium]
MSMLKTGEADIAYLLQGPLAEEAKEDPKLTLAPVYPPNATWINAARSKASPLGRGRHGFLAITPAERRAGPGGLAILCLGSWSAGSSIDRRREDVEADGDHRARMDRPPGMSA